MGKSYNDKICSKRKRKYGTHYTKREENNNKRKIIDNIRTLIDKEKFEYAFINMEDYKDKYGMDCYLMHEYGKYYARQMMYDNAFKYFDLNVSNEAYNMYYSLYELGRIYFNRGNFIKAEECYNRIINSDHPDKCFAILELGRISAIKENYFFAERCFKSIIDNNYTNFKSALEEIIELYTVTNRIEEAEEYLAILKEYINPLKYAIYNGVIEMKKGNMEDGKKILSTTFSNKNYYVKSKLHIMKEYYNNLDYVECIKEFESIEHKNNYYIECLRFAINSAIKIDRLDLARKYIDVLASYGKDFLDYVYYFLGKISLLEKNYDAAKMYFDKITYANLNMYISFVNEKVQMYIRLNELEKANEILEEAKEKLNISSVISLRKLEIYLKDRLNLEDTIEPVFYIEKLIKNYNYNDVISHIEMHLDENENKRFHSVFSENVDINNLFCEMMEKIKNIDPRFSDFVDVYYIPYNNIGYLNGEELHLIKVVTLINSKDIINIYPVSRKRNYIFDSLDKNENEVVTKVKKMSQIDKFNRRYAGVNR